MDDPGPSASGVRHEAVESTGPARRDLRTLADILLIVEDDPRLMDANLEEVHEIAVRLAKVVREQRFAGTDFTADTPNRDFCHIFDQARLNESDEYEVYADDLERHERRQHKDLSVADSDRDKFTLVKRRRSYIASLFELYERLSCVITPSNAEQPSP